MMSAPPRSNEDAALASLQALQVLDTAPEPELDALAQAASLACGTPIGLISLVDAQRQWFKANVGLPGTTGTSRTESFCAYTVLDEQVLEVPDASADARFVGNPLVTTAPHIRFYAGAPICLANGAAIGALCVIDRQPRQLDATQRAVLASLALAAARLLEGRQTRLEAQQALRLERKRLADIIEGTDTATLEWNLRTGLQHVGARLGQMIGRQLDAREPMPLADWLALMHPNDRVRHDHLLREHLAGRSALFQCESRVRHVDGHWVWVLTRGRVVEKAGPGDAEWLFGVRMDISARKRQEEALRRSENLLGRTGRVAGVGGWEVDLASGAILWSEETRRIHGVGSEYQPTLAEAIHFYAPEAQPVIEAAVQRGIETGEPWDLELPMVRADGQRIWVRAVGAAEFEDGNAARLIGAFQDISERRELLAQVAASAKQLRDLYDNAPCGYHSLDAEGRFLHINATALDWLGCSRDAVVGKAGIVDFFNDEGKARFERNFPTLKSSGRVEGLEFDLVPWQGAGRRVSISATAVYDEQGRFVMSRTVMFDITELYRVRRELQRLLVEQAAVLDNELIGMARIRSGHLVWANRGMAQMFGYQPIELVGMPTTELYAEHADHHRVATAVQAAVRPGQAFRLQVKMLKRDGLAIWIDLSSVLLADDPPELLTLFVDITPLKDAEVERIRAVALDAENTHLRETDRLKDQFLANMSHELRTPLNAVIGFAHLLKGGVIKPDSPKFAGYLGQIASSGQHLLQLIDSLLDHAKAASGQLGFQLQAVDLGEAVHEAVAMLEAKCEQRGVIVDAHVQPTLGPALADPLRLRQVLLNLVGNAVKFSQKGGRVTVRAMQGEGTWARVEVQDAGIGIAAGDLPRLFTAFTQLSEGNTKSHDGTGIGLALVRRIVEAQGGEVGVSSSPGEGSTFHFTLPLVDGRQLAP